MTGMQSLGGFWGGQTPGQDDELARMIAALMAAIETEKRRQEEAPERALRLKKEESKGAFGNRQTAARNLYGIQGYTPQSQRLSTQAMVERENAKKGIAMPEANESPEEFAARGERLRQERIEKIRAKNAAAREREGTSPRRFTETGDPVAKGRLKEQRRRASRMLAALMGFGPMGVGSEAY